MNVELILVFEYLTYRSVI